MRLPSLAFWVLVLALPCACAAPVPVPEKSPREVLANARAALSSHTLAARTRGVRLAGRSRHEGQEGTFELLFEPRGAFVQTIDSEHREVVGFDGEECWAVDGSGIGRELALGSTSRVQGWIWFQTGLWLLEPGDCFEFALDPRSGMDEWTLHVRRRDGPYHATIVIDAETWLPRRLEFPYRGTQKRYELDDWRAPLGFPLPHRVSVTGVGGALSEFEVTSVSSAPDFIRDPYARPPDRQDVARFNPELPARVETRVARSGHPLVRASLDGYEGWFLLDSGAGGLFIDPAFADAVGLASFGEVAVVGAGGAVSGRYRAGGELMVGPMKFDGVPWLELELAFLEPTLGLRIDGVLGYDVFARAVVHIDLRGFADGPRVELFEPTHFSGRADLPPSSSWQAVQLDNRMPCVEARFAGGGRGWFRLDTGSDATVTFHTHVIPDRASGAVVDARAHSLAGVGGTGRAARGTIDWFELGPVRFDRPTVTYSRAQFGGLTDLHTVGTLGVGFLASVEMWLDYPGGRVAFQETSR